MITSSLLKFYNYFYSTMSSTTSEPIPAAPPPWTLKAKIWSLPIYVTSKMAATLSADKGFLYSASEANSSFSSDKLVGGLALAQIIRYTESPAGPYDELIISPGYFEWASERKSKDGKPIPDKRKNLRVTKIFVSQEITCFNGRKSESLLLPKPSFINPQLRLEYPKAPRQIHLH